MRERKLDDWLIAYQQYVENSEPPMSYHLWTAISTIAAVLQRRCWLPFGMMGNIYPNFYITLVGPPGGRKGTAMKIGKRMLQALEIPLGADCITRAALVQELEAYEDEFLDINHMANKHCSLSIFSEELAVFLGEKNPDMIITLTDLFDSPDKWSYVTKGSGKNYLSNIWLNIMGAITPSLLHSRAVLDAVGGGLTSRMIFVVEEGKRKRVAIPYVTEEEETLYENLLSDLSKIRMLRGPFKPMAQTMYVYQQWYEGSKSDPNSALATAVQHDKFTGYNERRALHLLKLMMIVSAATREDMVITPECLARALLILNMTEDNMPKAFFGVGRAEHSDIIAGIINTVGLADDGVRFQELAVKYMSDVTSADLQVILRTLLDANVLMAERMEDNKFKYKLNPTFEEENSNG